MVELQRVSRHAFVDRQQVEHRHVVFAQEVQGLGYAFALFARDVELFPVRSAQGQEDGLGPFPAQFLQGKVLSQFFPGLDPDFFPEW